MQEVKQGVACTYCVSRSHSWRNKAVHARSAPSHVLPARCRSVPATAARSDRGCYWVLLGCNTAGGDAQQRGMRCWLPAPRSLALASQYRGVLRRIRGVLLRRAVRVLPGGAEGGREGAGSVCAVCVLCVCCLCVCAAVERRQPHGGQPRSRLHGAGLPRVQR
jgi:hypothetical protein